jgi:hypothetical protein
MDIGELELRIPTVSEINDQLVDFIKEYTKQKVADILTEISSDEQLPRDKLMLYIRKLNFDDLATISNVKKPRKSICTKDRCHAKTSKGERCTRKRKDELPYCGSHESSRPYGEVDEDSQQDQDQDQPQDQPQHQHIKSKPLIRTKTRV